MISFFVRRFACIRASVGSGITRREKTRGVVAFFVVLYGFVIGWNLGGALRDGGLAAVSNHSLRNEHADGLTSG